MDYPSAGFNKRTKNVIILQRVRDDCGGDSSLFAVDRDRMACLKPLAVESIDEPVL